MFLTIPLELRDTIYIEYLTSIPDAGSPTSNNRDHRIHEDNTRWKQWTSGSQWWDKQEDEFLETCNFYPNPSTHPATPSNSALPLLLCNRQVHSEVSSTIDFLISNSKDMMQYELDCEIVDQLRIYPTWVHIPPVHPKRSVPISCVHVTFRHSGHPPDPEVDETREAWLHGCGGPGRMIRSLQALLNRFLKFGPNFLTLPADPPASAVAPYLNPASSISTAEKIQVQSRTSNLKFGLGRFVKQHFPVFHAQTTRLTDTGNRITPGHTGANTAAHYTASSSTAPITPMLNIHVDKLVLNFVTPPISPEELYRRDNNGEVIQPRMAASIVEGYLDILLRGGYGGDSIKERDYILSRLGYIQLEVDGGVYKVFELQNMVGIP